jgi:hypothetical protein
MEVKIRGECTLKATVTPQAHIGAIEEAEELSKRGGVCREVR